MEYRRLGNSGLQVSLAGLGCNNFGMRIDAAQTRAVVHRALDEGITLFDTADIYGNRGQSEDMLGKALENRRHEIVLAKRKRTECRRHRLQGCCRQDSSA